MGRWPRASPRLRVTPPFSELRGEFREVVARLDSGSAHVWIPGLRNRVPLHRGRVAEWFRSQLYRPGTAAAVPWLIHRAPT
jgi:hypothetical protein